MESHILQMSICPDGMKPQPKCLFLQLAFVVLTMLVSSCNDRKEYQLSFEKAKSMIEHAPDSSLSIIDGLLQHEKELSTKLLMRCRLYQLSAENQLDTVFRSTDRAEQLVKYFGRRGNANERMLAYYLLARAYSDMGEAPAAIEHFKIASECADTTSSDCDYRQLCRVYSQMSLVFHYQRMLQEELNSIEQGVNYALQGKDTLAAIALISSKSSAFNWMGQKDSVLYYNDLAYSLYKQYGFADFAAQSLSTSIDILAERGETDKAREYLNIFESQSGFFDASGNIERGREVYYYRKGLYYLAVHQPDSAIAIFRKELQFKDDYNQEGATRGLSLAYRMKQQPDSSAKYAILSYEYNDSSSLQTAADAVAATQAMFDYNRHLQKAQQEEKRADRVSSVLRNVILISLVFAIFVLSYFKKMRREKRASLEMYEKNKLRLVKLEKEIEILNSSGEKYHDLIKDKEQEITRLKAEICNYNPKVNSNLLKAENRLVHDERYLSMEAVRTKGVAIDQHQWRELDNMIAEILPDFDCFLKTCIRQRSDTDYKTCVLIRLHVKPNVISGVLGLSPSAISKARSTMLHDIFEITGKPSEFDRRILAMV